MKKRSYSSTVYKNLCNVIPGGVNSPVRACQGLLEVPLIVDSGEGATITDVDGYEYLDFCMSWGALIHGHAHPEVLGAVQKRMNLGTSFGITAPVEEQLARKIVDCVSSIDKVRFVSSGTEATMTAARLARGYTGHDTIVKFIGNYHGHADFFLVEAGSAVLGLTPTSSSEGIPDDIVKHTVCLPYNNLETCKKFFESSHAKNLAAVIVEPVAGNMGVVLPSKGFLELLRCETKKKDALLIFDEVITGFRVSSGGAQQLYGVMPDLTCLGKIIGGGFPLAAVGGREEIMDFLAPKGQVFQAGTLSGNPVAAEAGFQALSMLDEGVYKDLESKVNLLTLPIEEYILKHKINACLQKVGSMFTIFIGQREVSSSQRLNREYFRDFFRFLFDNGIYAPPSPYEAWFVSTAHTQEQLEYARETILEYLSSNQRKMWV